MLYISHRLSLVRGRPQSCTRGGTIPGVLRNHQLWSRHVEDNFRLTFLRRGGQRFQQLETPDGQPQHQVEASKGHSQFRTCPPLGATGVRKESGEM